MIPDHELEEIRKGILRLLEENGEKIQKQRSDQLRLARRIRIGTALGIAAVVLLLTVLLTYYVIIPVL